MKLKEYSKIECALIFLIIAAVIVPFIFLLRNILGIKTSLYAARVIDVSFGFLSVLWIVTLLIWVYKKQVAKSSLWNWLPPFVFFERFSPLGRNVFLIVLCIVQFISLVINIMVRWGNKQ